MLVTMIIITAMLGGAVTLVGMQLSSTRSSGMYQQKQQALHCAEAGLVAARSVVIANYQSWNATFQAGGQATWLSAVNRDLDGDNVADLTLSIKDNDDEVNGTNDPNNDSDLAVFVVSTCTKYPDTPASVAELVRFSGGGNCYQSQLGGCGGNSNAN